MPTFYLMFIWVSICWKSKFLIFYTIKCFNKIFFKNIINFKNQLNITYPLVIAGNTQKGSVNIALPMLANFVAFPTLIVIDKNGKVRNIHTGYSGPATGIYYTEFKNQFIATLENYLNEK